MIPPLAKRLHGPGFLSEPGASTSTASWAWPDFNARVLAQARLPEVPPRSFERAKFLAIFSSNLDEFYMVRRGGGAARAEVGLRSRRRPTRLAARRSSIGSAARLHERE